ncbi:MAG: pimeloyl-ACP methyl ester carboxylesterase, partial [Candidatus Azotimanducaceae bacterium]
MSLLSSIEGKLMTHHITLATLLTTFLVAALIPLSNAYAANAEKAIPRYLDASRDVQNEEIDVTLFRGAANNSYFEVYWKALPEEGADEVEMEAHMVDLRPERDVTLHVEIYNPNGTIPLIVTPGGNGDTNGFRSFARNIAAAAPEFKVIIYDRRNLGLSQVTFGSEPQMVEEGEDLHV